MFVTVEELYKGLLAHGATPIQAAAIVGNSVSEVGPNTADLSPGSELRTDYYEPGCCGLWCWEPAFFDPPRPIGDPLVDMDAQIAYLKQTGGFDRAFGVDAQAAGRDFALTYERCEFCMVGGQQWVARGNQAAAVARLAAEHGWDRPPTPERSMHYDRYPCKWQPGVRRYDVLRELVHTGKITRRERTWFAARTVQCRMRATFTIRKARRLGSRKHPNWNDHRGWIYQQLHLRGEGRRAEPTT